MSCSLAILLALQLCTSLRASTVQVLLGRRVDSQDSERADVRNSTRGSLLVPIKTVGKILAQHNVLALLDCPDLYKATRDLSSMVRHSASY